MEILITAAKIGVFWIIRISDDSIEGLNLQKVSGTEAYGSKALVLFWYLRFSRNATVPGLNLCGFLTPLAGADFRVTFVASCFLGAFPPVHLRAIPSKTTKVPHENQHTTSKRRLREMATIEFQARTVCVYWLEKRGKRKYQKKSNQRGFDPFKLQFQRLSGHEKRRNCSGIFYKMELRFQNSRGSPALQGGGDE
ncbi:hypothetical protein Tco_1146501 [Tanacetum coccineum]